MMTRISTFLFVTTLVSCTSADSQNIESLVYHKNILTLDSHIDIPDYLTNSDKEGAMQVDLVKMHKGALDSGFFIVFTNQGPLTSDGYAKAYEEAIKMFNAIESQAKNNPDEIGIARNPSELAKLVQEGKLASAIGIENAYSLGPNLEHLDEFYMRGASYVGLTHVGHNDFADSSTVESGAAAVPLHHGLSERGKLLIQKLNQLGVMVDVSHASTDTVMQSAELSHAPIIASHSGVKGVFNHPRNLSDEEMIAITQKGGVIQIVAYSEFLKAVPEEKLKKKKQIIEAANQRFGGNFKTWTPQQIAGVKAELDALDNIWPKPKVTDFVDHIDYAVKLIGIDHVGIASDFGGGGGILGWESAAESAGVTSELVRRGYSKTDIEKIWGGNLLRIWADVQKTGADFKNNHDASLSRSSRI